MSKWLRITLVSYWNSHLLHKSQPKKQQQQQKRLHLLPPLPRSYTASSTRYIPAKNPFYSTHSVPILGTSIFFTPLLLRFAMCRIAKTLSIKRHRFCEGCLAFILATVVLLRERKNFA